MSVPRTVPKRTLIGSLRYDMPGVSFCHFSSLRYNMAGVNFCSPLMIFLFAAIRFNAFEILRSSFSQTFTEDESKYEIIRSFF